MMGKTKEKEKEKQEYSQILDGKKYSVSSSLVRGKVNQQVLSLGVLVLVLALLVPTNLTDAKTHHSKRQALAGSSSSSSGRENSNWWNVWWQQYISEAELPTVRPIVSISYRGRTIHSRSNSNSDEQQYTVSDPDLSHELDDTQEDVDANLVLGNQRQAQQPINQELSRLVNERHRSLASGNENPRADNKQMKLAQRKSMQHHYNWQAVKPTFIQSGNRQPVDDSPLGIQMRRTMRLQQQQQQQQQQQFEQQEQQRFEEQQQHQMLDYNEDELIDQNNNSPDNEQPPSTMTFDRPRDSSSSSMMAGEGVVGRASDSESSTPSGVTSNINEPTSTTLGIERTRVTNGQTTQPATSITSTTTTAPTFTETSASSTSRPEETTVGTTSGAPTTTTTTQSPSTTASSMTITTTTAAAAAAAAATTTTTTSGQAQETDGSTTQTIASESPISEPGTRIVTPSQNQVQLENGKPATTPTTFGTLRPTTSSRFPARTTMTQTELQTTPVLSSTSLSSSEATPTSTTTQTNQSEMVTSTTLTPVTSVSSEGTTSPVPQSNETTTTTNSGAGGEDGDDDDDDEDGDDADEGSTTTDSTGSINSTSKDDGEEDRSTVGGSSTESTPVMSIATSQPMLPTIDLERLPKTTSTTPKSTQTTFLGETPIVLSTSQASTPTTPLRTTQPVAGKVGGEDITRITKPSTMTATTQDVRRPVDEESAITVPMDSLMKMMMNQLAEDGDRAKLEQELSSGTTVSPDLQSTTPLSTAPTTTSATTTTTNPSTTTTTTTSTTNNNNINSNTSLGTIDGATTTTTDSQQTTRGRLQPPPTTRAPQQIATSTLDEGPAIMTTISGTPPQRTVMVSLSPETINQADTDNSEGREPKIEMLDLDLMPIQRIMNENKDITRNQNQMIMVPIARLVEKPSTTVADLGQTGTPFRQQMDQEQEQQRPMTTLEVEPGMRLRPPQMPTTKSMMMSSIVMRTQQQNNKVAEPVYMIMMNNNQQPLDGNEQFITTTTTKKQSTPSVVMRTTTPARTTPGMMVMMMQRQQQQQEMQLQTLKTTRPSPTMSTSNDEDTIDKTTISLMRTTQPAVPTQQQQQQTSTTTLSDTTKQQQLLQTTTTQAPQTTGRLQDLAGEREGKSSSSNTDQPSTTQGTQMTTTSSPNTLLITDSPASLAEQPTVSTTTRSPSVDTSTTELERFVTTAKPADFTQPQASTTTTISPVTSGSPQDDTAKTTTLITRPVSSIEEQPTTPRSTTDVTQKEQTGSASQTTATTPPSTASTGFTNISRNQTDDQNQRPSSKRPSSSSSNVKGSAGRVGKQQVNGTSSSFIPSKLRADFGKQRFSNQPNTNVKQPQMGAAIRQFGGANRMSVLGNQPVPFGRPAAMTLPSRNQQPINRVVVEQPSFEYGPSIVVRRPDEPLANGQMPNCTLTGKNFCVLTKDYPMNEVRQAVERSFRSVRIMYEELQTVSDQELHKDQFNTTNNQAASGKFACQTQVEMMRPGWAKDEITKEWMLVVNTDVFPQRVRTESCAQPNTPCEFIAPFYDSTCQQRFSLHRMIAIDPHDPSRSPQVAVFRFPAGCVCRVHPIRKTLSVIS